MRAGPWIRTPELGWGALCSLILGCWLAASPALAGEADVLEVTVLCTTIRTCDFDAKVLHADIGFSHYADRFEVVAPDGEVLGVRVLRHPHVHEQPFVRRLIGVEIPDGVSEVTVRAHDSEHGFGGRTVTLQLDFPAKTSPAGAQPTGPSEGSASKSEGDAPE